MAASASPAGSVMKWPSAPSGRTDRPCLVDVRAMIAAGRSRHGATVHVQLAQGSAPAKIVPPVFYDAEGARLHG